MRSCLSAVLVFFAGTLLVSPVAYSQDGGHNAPKNVQGQAQKEFQEGSGSSVLGSDAPHKEYNKEAHSAGKEYEKKSSGQYMDKMGEGSGSERDMNKMEQKKEEEGSSPGAGMRHAPGTQQSQSY